MNKILEEISIESIKLGDVNISDAQRNNGWIGNNPATEQEILALEEKLGIILPEDYKLFLKATNGLPAINDVEPTFLSTSEVGFLRDLDHEIIEEFGYTAKARTDLYNAIIIGGLEEEQHFYLIPIGNKSKGWKYWKFAAWIPGEESYESLFDYFNNVLTFLKELNNG